MFSHWTDKDIVEEIDAFKREIHDDAPRKRRVRERDMAKLLNEAATRGIAYDLSEVAL